MTTSHGSRHRPYKVWSCDRQTRKAVVASSLRELKEKGSEKLGYSSQPQQHLQEGPPFLRVVLECDGTEVEEDTYFQTVPADTVFLLLRPAEKWLPPGVEALRAGHDNIDSGIVTDLQSELSRIVNTLRVDIANLILLDERKLQLVSDMDVNTESRSSNDRQLLSLLKEAADRLLLERQSFKEAKEVLDLLCKPEVPSEDNLDSSTTFRDPSSDVSRLFQEARQLLNQASTPRNQSNAEVEKPKRKRKR